MIKEYVDGEFINVAVPCWHFYIEVPHWVGNSEADVIVNAITGAVSIY